jgi:hypothetical protein
MSFRVFGTRIVTLGHPPIAQIDQIGLTLRMGSSKVCSISSRIQLRLVSLVSLVSRSPVQ